MFTCTSEVSSIPRPADNKAPKVLVSATPYNAPCRMRLVFSVLVLTLFAAEPVAAQTPPPPPQPPRVEGDQAAARFRLADSYLQAQQYDRAIAILEDLLAANPGSLPVVDRLKDAYLAANRPVDAIGLLQKRIDEHGPLPSLLAELGSLYVASGDLPAAEAVWNRALASAPDNVQTYRMLYAVLVQNRMWEKARDVLLSGRQRLRDEDLFRVELAELYSRSNQHGEALTEWAGLLAESPNRLSFVQGRIGRMLDQEAAATAFREALDRLIRRDPMNLAYRRLAAWLAAESGDFSAGLDHTRAVDRLGRESGESLLGYANAALQAGAFDAAQRSFELIMEAHPASQSAVAALLSSALLHEKRGEEANERAIRQDGHQGAARHYGEAVQAYERFLAEHPTSAATPVAMQRLARLQRDIFRKYARARELLEQIVARHAGEDHATEAQFALGELAMIEDDLPGARRAFTQLDNQLRTGDRAERARLQLAMLDFYEGNFEMALSRVNAMKRNTATDVANNAIDLKLVLAENQGPDEQASPLRTFARTELRIRQHRNDEALDALDGLLEAYPQHPLMSLVKFRRAETLRRLDRPHEALVALRALPEEHPESYLVDRALFITAEIYERDLQDLSAAMEGYTRLLRNYPGSLLAPEARARIRQLRDAVQS
jgi:cellulose synthase operon protein C